MTEQDYDYVCKVIIVGNSNVGKTSVLQRYVNGKPPDAQHKVTLGVDFQIKTLVLSELNGIVVKMQVWDTAGQERFQSMTKNFWNGAKGAVVVFALDDRKSFDALESNWLPSIKECVGTGCEYTILVGNKCDVPDERRCIARADAEAFAKKHVLDYIETSALTNANVSDMFYHFCLRMARRVHERHLLEEADEERKRVVVTNLATPPGLDGNGPPPAKGCGC
jgi:small GTP-binding protein